MGILVKRTILPNVLNNVGSYLEITELESGNQLFPTERLLFNNVLVCKLLHLISSAWMYCFICSICCCCCCNN